MTIKAPKILAFAGSAREGSFNKKLIKVAAKAAQDAGAEVTLIDLNDYPMPLMNEDLEAKSGLPEFAKKVKELMQSHDGFLISTPEYNSAMPALLKNTIDWASRKTSKEEAPLSAYKGKVAGIFSASPGGFGGLRSLLSLRSLLTHVGVLVVVPQFALSRAHEAFDEDGQLKDKKQQESVERISQELVSVIMKICNALLIILLASLPVHAAEGIETVKVKDHLHVLVSPKGGNVVVSSGEDGTFLIDDQLAGRSEIVEAAAKELGAGEIKFILNTHYHFDHTGGNELFGGNDALIIAHDNVRKRLSRDEFIKFFNKDMPALSKEGLPVVTLTSDMALHVNGDDARLIHAAYAHTDGDTFAYFNKANVIVAGDLVFSGMYPFIDTEHGGSIKGVLNGVKLMLELADEATIIIPGHGPLMSKSELKSYADALGAIADNVEASIALGKSRDEVIASKPTADFDGAFKGGVVNADQFAGIVFDSLTKASVPK